MKALAWNAVALSLIAGGVYLATKGVGGWGWLIFCGVICAQGPDKPTA